MAENVLQKNTYSKLVTYDVAKDTPISKPGSPPAVMPPNCDMPEPTSINVGLELLGVSAPFYLAAVNDFGCVMESFYCDTIDAACNIIEKQAKNYKLKILLNSLGGLEQLSSQNSMVNSTPIDASPEFLIAKISKIAIDIKPKPLFCVDFDKSLPKINAIIDDLCANFKFPEPSFLNYGQGCKLIFNADFDADAAAEEQCREFVSVFKDKFAREDLVFFEDFNLCQQYVEIPGTLVSGSDTANSKRVTYNKSAEEAALTSENLEYFLSVVQKEAEIAFMEYQYSSRGKFDAQEWCAHRFKCLNMYVNPVDEKVYADMKEPISKHYQPICVCEQRFIDCLMAEIFENYSCTPNRKEKKFLIEASMDAVNKARSCGRRYNIHSRIAKIGKCLFYDLHRSDGLVYAINEEGHFMLKKGDCLYRNLHFASSGTMQSQEIPIRASNQTLPQLLDPFLNMSDHSKVLLIITIICWFLKGSNYFLWLNGLNGSGKSLLTSFINAIVDPTTSKPGTLPTTVRDLSITLSSRYLIVFDNLSRINDNVSNLLCQAAYGSTYSTRKLYSNAATTCVNFHNVVILNSINEDVVKKPDLLQRIVPIKLHTINANRRSETEMKNAFKQALPSIMYNIFETLRQALSILPETEAPTNFRFMDAAHLGCAISRVLYGDEKVFTDAFLYNTIKGSLELLQNDPLTNIVLEWLRQQESLLLNSGGSFPLTLQPMQASKFYEKIVSFATQNNVNITIKGLAPDASAFTRKLNNYSINFNNVGVEFFRVHTNSANIINITINKTLSPSVAPTLNLVA